MIRNVLLILVAMLAAEPALLQEVASPPNAIPDKPFDTTAAQNERILKAIEPYVQHARETYPAARARFLAGLPKGQVFFVTARLVDSRGKFEQAFIRVKSIKKNRITGVIASPISLVQGYAEGDAYRLVEGDLIDWTIVMPDGAEEGNFVGNFLDTYHGEEPGK